MTQSLNVRKFSAYALVAGIINSIIFLIAKGADATMVVNQGGSREIVLPMVLGSTLLGLLVAALSPLKLARNHKVSYLSHRSLDLSLAS